MSQNDFAVEEKMQRAVRIAKRVWETELTKTPSDLSSPIGLQEQLIVTLLAKEIYRDLHTE